MLRFAQWFFTEEAHKEDRNEGHPSDDKSDGECAA